MAVAMVNRNGNLEETMGKIKFAASEYCFPIWGSLAMEMAKEAGFDGMEITDGGGYLQPHPLNNRYVEYERLGLDLRREDSFPMTDEYVQNDYMEAAAKCGIELIGLKLHLLETQGFIKAPKETLAGRECIETIDKAIAAAKAMHIPVVTLSARGLFGVFQHEYAYEKLLYAAEAGEENGIKIYVTTEIAAEKQIARIDSLGRKVKLDFNTIDPELCDVGNPEEMIRKIGRDRVGQFRVKDLTADSEGFLTEETAGNALLGRGDSKFKACAEAIKEIGFEGWVLSDTAYYSSDLNPVGGDYETLLAKDVETLQHVFDRKGRNSYGKI